MFTPKEILYEKDIENYELGRELLEKYKDVPKHIIENHNNIPEMRSKQNCEFANIKKNLISIMSMRSNVICPDIKIRRCNLSVTTPDYWISHSIKFDYSFASFS